MLCGSIVLVLCGSFIRGSSESIDLRNERRTPDGAVGVAVTVVVVAVAAEMKC